MRIALAILVAAGASGSSCAAQPADPKRGEYLARLGGCLGCHTEAKKGAVPFSGGRALKTPFGTFFGPNITPHPQAGIGGWTEADFARAMRDGRRPDGANLFPAFPYPAFTRIVGDDLRDLWAYLRTLPPSAQPNRPHDLRFPFGWRFAVTFWKWLYFTPGPPARRPQADGAHARGAYLVQALGHCGECHSPRNWLGATQADRALAGGRGADGNWAPNLTPTGLELWSDAELRRFFATGITREDETVADAMDEVVRNTTRHMRPEDLAAMIAYLRSLPPRPDARR